MKFVHLGIVILLTISNSISVKTTDYHFKMKTNYGTGTITVNGVTKNFSLENMNLNTLADLVNWNNTIIADGVTKNMTKEDREVFDKNMTALNKGVVKGMEGFMKVMNSLMRGVEALVRSVGAMVIDMMAMARYMMMMHSTETNMKTTEKYEDHKGKN